MLAHTFVALLDLRFGHDGQFASFSPTSLEMTLYYAQRTIVSQRTMLVSIETLKDARDTPSFNDDARSYERRVVDDDEEWKVKSQEPACFGR